MAVAIDAGNWTAQRTREAGGREATEPGLKRTRDAADRFSSPRAFAAAATALAHCHLAGFRPRMALEDALAAIELLRKRGMWELAGDLVAVAVEAQLTLGRPGSAGRLVTEYRAGIEAATSAEARASLLMCEGMLSEAEGSPELAAAKYEAAHAAWLTMGRLYEAALAQERWARMLAPRHPERAADLLVRAAQALRREGSAWRAEAMMASRAAPRAARGRRRHGGRPLSSRQEQIVRLAEQGSTNQEIASLLKLSVRTVESHIRLALQKDGSRSRLSRPRLPSPRMGGNSY